MKYQMNQRGPASAASNQMSECTLVWPIGKQHKAKQAKIFEEWILQTLSWPGYNNWLKVEVKLGISDSAAVIIRVEMKLLFFFDLISKILRA